MKVFISIFILSLSVGSSLALRCSGCEAKSANESCSFVYDCPADTEYCEALVTKFENSYSVITSCATMEKCGMNSANQGLQKCDHLSSSTECFHCCDTDECNRLSETMNMLPTDMFPHKTENDAHHDYDYDIKMVEDLERALSKDKEIIKEKEMKDEKRREEKMKTAKISTENLNTEVATYNVSADTLVSSTSLTAQSVNLNTTTEETLAVNTTEVSEAEEATETQEVFSPTLTSIETTTEEPPNEPESVDDIQHEALPELPVENNALVDHSQSASATSKAKADLAPLVVSIILIAIFTNSRS